MQTALNKTLRFLARRLFFFLPAEKRHRIERRLRGREELRRLQAADCVFVSFGKSGRTWVRVLLSRYYALRYGLGGDPLLGFDNLHRVNPQIPRIFFSHDNYLADFTGNRDSKEDFYCKKVVLLVRTPQDVAVSQYFQWKFRMKEHKKKLNGYPSDPDLSIYDFVMSEEFGLRRIVEFMNAWAEAAGDIERFHLVRYEDLRAAPEATFAELTRFIDGDSDANDVAAAIEYASVENMRRLEASRSFGSGRMRAGDEQNPDSFKVRRAKVGGYRDYFEDDENERIDELVRSELSSSFRYDRSDADVRRTPDSVASEANA